MFSVGHARVKRGEATKPANAGRFVLSPQRKTSRALTLFPGSGRTSVIGRSSDLRVVTSGTPSRNFSRLRDIPVALCAGARRLRLRAQSWHWGFSCLGPAPHSLFTSCLNTRTDKCLISVCWHSGKEKAQAAFAGIMPVILVAGFRWPGWPNPRSRQRPAWGI